ncbi:MULTISPECIES: PhoX family phosphatase [unclassified Azospirillum]|uniref:PhoX family protein n=1 Tax=unclassified Azospirillum TaxID=2630922 RepID=UPI000B63E058|nr:MULTISPECIES: PhoX family phosphatase [unclassified Azospirillum]SNS49659.1 hypothetical protein SAMN05880556_1063 [Azospirillum sp. RU38E]SNS72241.1 hypothetical protein SAMN05880591_106134 [Azospirillum sp. RU37A]
MSQIDTPEIDRDNLEERGIGADQTFDKVLEASIGRRNFLRSGAVAGAALSASGIFLTGNEAKAAAADLSFTSIGESKADKVVVPAGYEANTLIRWGDPLFPGMPAFDPLNQTPADQAKRFGFNCDMVAMFPERFGAPAKIGRLPYPSYIMCVNHEYTRGSYMFENYTGSEVQALTEIEAHGFSVVNVRVLNGRWSYDVTSPYNRRVTGTTPMQVTGPVAGHDKLKTPADPTGTLVLGTFNNCAGGFTPWGTYLSAEENFDQYFANRSKITDAKIALDHQDYTIPSTSSSNGWEKHVARFDCGKPEGVNEPYRFGWIVEIDPYDPTSTPKKRTAMGRFKHEAATIALTRGTNTVTAYSGCDTTFEYVYKFVSAGTYTPGNRAANMNLLENGKLYAARFNADGTGVWLPLDLNDAVSGPKLAASTYPDGSRRFQTQADVLLNSRRAGDAVGATPMDRPEDLQATVDDDFYGNGKMYIVLTNNSSRQAASSTANYTSSARAGAGRAVPAKADAANPRGPNRTGHIIEVTEANNDHAATSFTWRIFLLAGDPAAGATAVDNISLNGISTFTGDRFGSPDNITFDNSGNIWIATDGTPSSYPFNDGLYAAPLNVPAGQPVPVKRFLAVPAGAECCGPLLSPDNSSLFVAVQHPGEDSAGLYSNTQSKWPDGEYPRPSVVWVRRTDGGRIGS